ncbi:hypothetical protein Pfo_019368 [Paulownia fortunei]|nr:hypothetical protein Pfo_019368 [Paulownia fortunei]
MDAVEILLLCVVGFCVFVFLILDNLDSLEESRKTCHEAEQSGDIDDSGSKTRVGSSTVESAKKSGHEEEEKSVGADGEAEKQVVSENFNRPGFQEIAEEEETENPVNVSCENSGFCSGFSSISGNNGDDICRNRGISEDDGEGEEEFIDDWEGIERTELEKIFGEAVVFVSSMSNDDQIGDVELQLYGLQKVALEGPCHGSQPMALKISARSKWNAWQKLGNMSREMAMEKYVDILSKAIPGWKGEGTLIIQDAAISEDLTSTPQNKNGVEAER